MATAVSQVWTGARAWLRAHPLVGDALLAAGLFGLQVSTLLLALPERRPPSLAVTVAWGVLDLVAITIRRRWPLVSVAVSVIYWLGVLFGYPTLQSSGFGIIVIGYTVAAYLPLRRALVATSALWAPILSVGAAQHAPRPANVPTWYLLASNLMVAVIAFFVGRTVHNRRAYTTALEERARTAERNQQALAEQAVTDERRRIARELHDVVAHHVSVMGVLATGARRVLARDPAAADQALQTVEETGRTALREMRRLLTVLRTEAEPGADLAPQPGLGGIEALVEQVREAGLPVTLRVDGSAAPLDPGVALTVYRIVQEALTNTLKHAGKAAAEVRLDFGRLWLNLEISDTGRGPRPDPSHIGHGLLGMRERVALYGGTLRTGPRPGGGFRVAAKIPLDPLDVKGAVP